MARRFAKISEEIVAINTPYSKMAANKLFFSLHVH